METVFFDSAEDRHAQLVGGVTALERRVREVAKQGATRAVVAARAGRVPARAADPGRVRRARVAGARGSAAASARTWSRGSSWSMPRPTGARSGR